MLFDALTDEEKALVAGICKIREYAEGATIVRAGEPGRTLLVVRKGRAEVRKDIGTGVQKFLKELKDGDFFGEMSFLADMGRSADVVATSKCEVLEMGMKDFDELCVECPVLGWKVYRLIALEMAKRLQAGNEELRRAIRWAMEGTV